MLILGSHVHFEKEQLLGCVKEAISYDANAFMFYTGAPQNTYRVPINDQYTLQAYELMKQNNIALENIICHAPYIINLANKNELEKYDFSMKFLRNEIERCQDLGIKYIVFHPGSAVKHDRRTALNNIIEGINNVLLPNDSTVLLLETMAGKGTELGINLEELKYIYNGVELKDNIGFCLDTCHLNDSGVDLNNFDDYLKLFDSIIGLNKIKCIHINDSKNVISSHKDRHENIGYGTIGFDKIMSIIYNPLLKNIPKILETPYINDKAPYKFEIAMIKTKTFDLNLINEVSNS